MHILALDIGNTRASTACFRDGMMAWRRDMATEVLPGALYALSDAHFELCVISCVSQRVSFVTDEMRRALNCPVLFVDAASAPLCIHYDSPERLGQDRIVNALGSRVHTQGGAIVIDMGTATHFDIIDPKGEFWGGPILAGLETMLQALTHRIVHLPHFELSTQVEPISQNTISAMNTGTILCAAGGIERILYEIRKRIDYPVKTILTGGNAHLVEPHIAYDIWAPNLTLEGLWQYAERSMQRTKKISA